MNYGTLDESSVEDGEYVVKSRKRVQMNTMMAVGYGILVAVPTLILFSATYNLPWASFWSSSGFFTYNSLSSVDFESNESVPSLDEWLEDLDAATQQVRPSVIFLLADDLGWNSIGYRDYDLSFATPFMSSLAQKGIIMDNYYGQEMCTPSRASLLTGRYPLTVGMQYHMIQENLAMGLDLDETTIAEAFQDNGYKTYMFGKWDLGHYSPLYLPTARGFDYYIGYLNGENRYWSKKNPFYSQFRDMLESDADCYYPYQGEDIHNYSTFFFRDKAIDVIKNHDDTSPFFMYLSFQAVHNPFSDVNHYENGIPKEYLSEGVYDQIMESVTGRTRRQYAMALSLMDDAISDIYDALEDKGLADTTYIVFASDNGGCYVAGGKNGPLRGTKGTLFEGGVKVDSFIYSPLLPSGLQGSVYKGLMHTSDWFPTLLHLVGISYAPDSKDFALDGISQLSGWFGEGFPRDYLLYNYYTNVEGSYFDKWKNGSFAIRNERYKLMHTYNSSDYGKWYDPSTLVDNDDDIESGSCNEGVASRGEFLYLLYDLVNDPYETTNLYHNEIDQDLVDAKALLYAQLDVHESNSKAVPAVPLPSRVCFQVWKKHDDSMVPWVKHEDLEALASGFNKTFPGDCYRGITDDEDNKDSEDSEEDEDNEDNKDDKDDKNNENDEDNEDDEDGEVDRDDKDSEVNGDDEDNEDSEDDEKNTKDEENHKNS